MELRHLRYFTAVADTLNFRRAAERVHIEQSPLSQQIKNLERELGVDLFTRTKRQVSLTHAGMIFLRDAKGILDKAEEATERVRRASKGAVGSLSIAYLTSMTNAYFTALIHHFQSQFPNVDVSLNDMLPSAILDALTQGTVDVGLMRGVFDTEEFTVEELWREPLIVALPKNHPLATRKKLTGELLAKEPFILTPDEGAMGYNDVVRMFCRSHGFNPIVRAEANQMQAIIWQVHLGMGLSLIPKSLRQFRRDNVVYRDLVQAPTVAAKMVYRKNGDSPVTKNFRDLAQSVVMSKIASHRT
jgi:DNA-binding transcriptional LysR family regulator